MRDFIPIAKPIIGNEEIQEVGKVLASGMLTQGESVKMFEDSFSSFLDVESSVAVSNSTVALDLTLKAIGLKPNDEVVSPAFSFIATANCILYQGLKPVFADVNPKTFNIDPEDLKEKINSHTKAVIGVHLYGQPFEIRAFKEICEDYHLILIEDCAQAHGAEYYGKKAGSFGIGCLECGEQRKGGRMTKRIMVAVIGVLLYAASGLAQELPQPQKHEKRRWYRIVRTQFKYGKDWEARQLIKDHLRPATVASGAGEPVMEFHNQTGPWHETVIWAMPEGPAEMEWALSPSFTKWFAALAKLEGGTDKAWAVITKYMDLVEREETDLALERPCRVK